MNKISEHIDSVVRCGKEYLVEAPPAPVSVKIELSRTCNFKCEFCNHSRLTPSTGFMSLIAYRNLLEDLFVQGVKEIAPFFYGESFLNPSLASAISYAAILGFERIFLTTNGTVATPEKVRECMAAGLHSLKFSLNYADAEQFHEKTGAKPELFEQLKNNIISARKIRDSYHYNCGLFASYILYDDKQTEQMQPLLEELRPYLDEIYSLPMYGAPSRIKQQVFIGGNQGRAENPVPPLPCWTLFKEAHINFDGTVCACGFNLGEQFIMGDLKKNSFMEIWHGEKFRALRRAHLALDVKNTVCDKCIIEKEKTP